MKNSLVKLLFVFTMFWPTKVLSLTATLTVVGDLWCPYNCEDSAKLSGYTIQAIQSIYDPLGVNINYINVPWSRAIKMVKNGDAEALIGVGKEEVPELIFPKFPIGVAQHRFYTLQTSDWEYKKLDDLNSITLGVIQNYSYGSLYADYIVKNMENLNRIQVTTTTEGLRQNILKLRKGRIDAIVEDKNVIFHFLVKAPDININLRDSGLAFREEIYLAFSPKFKNAEKHARIVSEGIAELRKSGKLRSILEQYGLEDWAESQP